MSSFPGFLRGVSRDYLAVVWVLLAMLSAFLVFVGYNETEPTQRSAVAADSAPVDDRPEKLTLPNTTQTQSAVTSWRNLLMDVPDGAMNNQTVFLQWMEDIETFLSDQARSPNELDVLWARAIATLTSSGAESLKWAFLVADADRAALALGGVDVVLPELPSFFAANYDTQPVRSDVPPPETPTVDVPDLSSDDMPELSPPAVTFPELPSISRSVVLP